MDRIEPDETPSQAWKTSLDATCNRLMSHYLSLLRAASSDNPNASIADENGEDGGDQVGHDSRGRCQVLRNELSSIVSRLISSSLLMQLVEGPCKHKTIHLPPWQHLSP